MFIDALETRFPGAIEKADESFGLQTIRVASDQSRAVLEHLRDDAESKFDFLTDLTVVHYPERELAFEVVYHLYSYPRHERLRVKVSIGDGETVRSVTDLWATANWMEREGVRSLWSEVCRTSRSSPDSVTERLGGPST